MGNIAARRIVVDGRQQEKTGWAGRSCNLAREAEEEVEEGDSEAWNARASRSRGEHE